MNDDPKTPDIPFSPGDWVIDRNNPGQPGQYTGKWLMAGPHVMIQLSRHYWRPTQQLHYRLRTTILRIISGIHYQCFETESTNIINSASVNSCGCF
jgi:hypothetical protein